MGIVFWILLGAVLGILGHLVDSRDAKGGLVGAILFGISGSSLGGFLASLVLGTGITRTSVSALLIALSGSIFLLLIQRTIFSQQERF